MTRGHFYGRTHVAGYSNTPKNMFMIANTSSYTYMNIEEYIKDVIDQLYPSLI
jgi:hypothetical protein